MRHYYVQSAPSEPPVVLLAPLMLAAEVHDGAPSTSAVTIPREHGTDPWVVDFDAEAELLQPLDDRESGVDQPAFLAPFTAFLMLGLQQGG